MNATMQTSYYFFNRDKDDIFIFMARPRIKIQLKKVNFSRKGKNYFST